VRVKLRNPDREVELAGPKTVRDVLAELGINPDTVLVIRDRDLVTRADRLADDDEVEIRPVISGGGTGGSGGQHSRRSGAEPDQSAARPRQKRGARGRTPRR
jgi:sulfur carrier protein